MPCSHGIVPCSHGVVPWYRALVSCLAHMVLYAVFVLCCVCAPQSMHVLMTRGGLLRRLGDDTPLLMLAGYLGAVIHDNEHRCATHCISAHTVRLPPKLTLAHASHCTTCSYRL